MKKLTLTLTLLALALFSTAAMADPIPPGGTGNLTVVPTSIFGAQVAPNLTSTITNSFYTATVTSAVYLDNNTGHLDFLYQLTNVGTPDGLSRLTVVPFNGATFFAATFNSAFGGFVLGTKAAIDATLSPSGGTIGFDFGNQAVLDATSWVLVDISNSDTFTIGTANTIDGAVGSGPAYAAVPEPASLALLGTGLLAGGGLVRRKLINR